MDQITYSVACGEREERRGGEGGFEPFVVSIVSQPALQSRVWGGGGGPAFHHGGVLEELIGFIYDVTGLLLLLFALEKGLLSPSFQDTFLPLLFFHILLFYLFV